MQISNFLSAFAIPATIIIIVLFGLKEKIKVFDTFLDGAKDGIKIVIELSNITWNLFSSRITS